MDRLRDFTSIEGVGCDNQRIVYSCRRIRANDDGVRPQFKGYTAVVSTNRHKAVFIPETEPKTGGGPTGLAAQGLGAKHFTPLLTASLAAHVQLQAWLAGWVCKPQHGSGPPRLIQGHSTPVATGHDARRSESFTKWNRRQLTAQIPDTLENMGPRTPALGTEDLTVIRGIRRTRGRVHPLWKLRI